MTVMLEQMDTEKMIQVKATGKLTSEDYEHFVPRIEEAIKKFGKVRVLFEMEDFHGWEAGALWKDLKFDAKHFSDIERLAMVGEKSWQKGMSVFCKPFTTAKVRYFGPDERDKAVEWLKS